VFEVVDMKGKACFTILLGFNGLEVYIGDMDRVMGTKGWPMDGQWMKCGPCGILEAKIHLQR